MILALGLVLALLWREVFSLESIMEGVPALGAAVFTLCAWAAALLAGAAYARRNWKRKGKQHGNVRQKSGPLGQRGAG